MESVKEIHISETTSPADAPALPNWLMVKKSFTSSSSPPRHAPWLPLSSSQEGGREDLRRRMDDRATLLDGRKPASRDADREDGRDVAPPSSTSRPAAAAAAATDVISRIELIGIPSNRERKLHFFHVKLVNREYWLIDMSASHSCACIFSL